jgi:hypothetical protein
MAVKSYSETCLITSYWEYGQTGTTPITTTTERRTVTTSQNWVYYELYDTWATSGSLQYSGSNFVETVAPPYPGGGFYDGQTATTYGEGMADVSVQSGGDPIYGWVMTQASIHNHNSSYTYNDGSYAGTLPYKSCTGTNASAPSYSGVNGQTATTTTTGTVTYEGDIPEVADTTKPTITITSHSGENAITVNWTASDNRELRTTSTFALYISGPNNTTLGFKEYVGINETSYTFQRDGAGNPLVVNAVYLARVVAVDSSNNTAYADRYVTYKKTKPASFAWTYSKSSESDVNLYASEWNNLLAKINEFREYKGLTRIETFTAAVVDDDISAIMFNQAVNIINTLSPSVSPPSAVDSEDEIYASKLNGLVTSLNSVA